MPVAGNAFLEDAQGALSDAVGQVGDTVGGIVDQVQDATTETPAETAQPADPDPIVDGVTDVEAIVPPPADVEPTAIPGYLAGTANGLALLQTTRVDSESHQGWVDITLDLILTSQIPEVEIEPSVSLNADGTQACFAASAGIQDCLSIEWGSGEQFLAVLIPHPDSSAVWPKGKALPWTVSFEIPANAQLASLVFGSHRVQLNLGGDQPADTSEHAIGESYRPEGKATDPVGSDGYFVGHHHGLAVTSVTRRPHADEPTWSIIDIELNVMSFGDSEALDLPIEVQAENGLVCYASGGESDCVQILWGGINQFNAILTSSREPGTVAWPRSKGWPTSISFIVPSNMYGATLLFGPSATHIDLLGEEAPPIPWDYAEHYKPLTGLTLHDEGEQTIDLIAIERDGVTADVRLVFEAVNRSEHEDFFPRISFDGSRVSGGGQVFDGLDPVAGWAPTIRTATSEALAPGQQSEITVVVPRVEGAGFPEIGHSDDPPDAMLLRLYGDSNPDGASPTEAQKFEPFYVTFDKRAGDNDAQFFFPDLAISDLALTPVAPTVGSPVTIAFDVANLGPRNAQTSQADLFIDGIYHSSVFIPAVAANSIVSASLTWIATLAPAELRIDLDAAGAVPESTDTNNTASATFSGGALPDLVITAVELIPPTADPGSVAQFAVTVSNQGKGDAQAYKVIASIASGGVFFLQYSALNAGQSETRIYPWTETIGSSAVILSVDASNDIQESDETNNLHNLGLPNLAATKNVLVNIDEFGVTRVSFEVTNAGEIAAPSARISIVVDGQTAAAQTMETGPIGVGETLTLLSRPVPDEGRHEFEVLIDPLDVIPESDNDDNSISFSYTIGELAELEVTGITLAPDPYVFGDLLTLRFFVENNGGKKSEVTIVQVYDATATTLLGTVIVPEIEPQEQSKITFEWTVETELATIEITVDPLLAVDETNEENNTSTLVVTTP
jgi:hypothetical protein